MKKSQEKNRKYLEMKANGHIAYQNLWDSAKAVVREKFIAINTYIKKKLSQISSLTLHLKKLEKEE